MTVNTYAHVLPGLRQEAADAIDGLLGNDDGPVGISKGPCETAMDL